MEIHSCICCLLLFCVSDTLVFLQWLIHPHSGIEYCISWHCCVVVVIPSFDTILPSGILFHCADLLLLTYLPTLWYSCSDASVLLGRKFGGGGGALVCCWSLFVDFVVWLIHYLPIYIDTVWLFVDGRLTWPVDGDILTVIHSTLMRHSVMEVCSSFCSFLLLWWFCWLFIVMSVLLLLTLWALFWLNYSGDPIVTIPSDCSPLHLIFWRWPWWCGVCLRDLWCSDHLEVFPVGECRPIPDHTFPFVRPFDAVGCCWKALRLCYCDSIAFIPIAFPIYCWYIRWYCCDLLLPTDAISFWLFLFWIFFTPFLVFWCIVGILVRYQLMMEEHCSVHSGGICYHWWFDLCYIHTDILILISYLLFWYFPIPTVFWWYLMEHAMGGDGVFCWWYLQWCCWFIPCCNSWHLFCWLFDSVDLRWADENYPGTVVLIVRIVLHSSDDDEHSLFIWWPCCSDHSCILLVDLHSFDMLFIVAGAHCSSFHLISIRSWYIVVDRVLIQLQVYSFLFPFDVGYLMGIDMIHSENSLFIPLISGSIDVFDDCSDSRLLSSISMLSFQIDREAICKSVWCNTCLIIKCFDDAVMFFWVSRWSWAYIWAPVVSLLPTFPFPCPSPIVMTFWWVCKPDLKADFRVMLFLQCCLTVTVFYILLSRWWGIPTDGRILHIYLILFGNYDGKWWFWYHCWCYGIRWWRYCWRVDAGIWWCSDILFCCSRYVRYFTLHSDVVVVCSDLDIPLMIVHSVLIYSLLMWYSFMTTTIVWWYSCDDDTIVVDLPICCYYYLIYCCVFCCCSVLFYSLRCRYYDWWSGDAGIHYVHWWWLWRWLHCCLMVRYLFLLMTDVLLCSLPTPILCCCILGAAVLVLPLLHSFDVHHSLLISFCSCWYSTWKYSGGWCWMPTHLECIWVFCCYSDLTLFTFLHLSHWAGFIDLLWLTSVVLCIWSDSCCDGRLVTFVVGTSIVPVVDYSPGRLILWPDLLLWAPCCSACRACTAAPSSLARSAARLRLPPPPPPPPPPLYSRSLVGSFCRSVGWAHYHYILNICILIFNVLNDCYLSVVVIYYWLLFYW